MAGPVCPRCFTPLSPSDRYCPFCRLPIPLAPSPERAPVPPFAPSPIKVCPGCRGELALPRRVPVPQPASSPEIWEAYVCPRCGRVEWYVPHR